MTSFPCFNAAVTSTRTREPVGMPRSSQRLIAVLSISILGCQESSQGARQSYVAADSATVEVVGISDLSALSAPQITKRLVYSTDAPSSDLDLHRVAGAVFLPDSSLAIANRGSFEIISLGSDGSVRWRTGRRGDGPGEYIDIARIGTVAGGEIGEIFVFDRNHRRFTFLDSQGAVTGVQSITRSPGAHDMVPLIHLDDREFLAVLETRPPLPPGVQRGPLFLVHGDGEGEILDTLGWWAGKERYVTQDQQWWLAVGFGTTALYAGRGRHAVVGTNDSLDLTLYRGSAPLARMRGGYSRSEVTAQEKEAWTEHYLANRAEDVRADWRRRLRQSTVRETYPAFGALGVDSSGRIWIGDYARRVERQRQWTVLGPDGSLNGTIDLPALRGKWFDFTVAIPSESHELLDVATDHIAILRLTELDEEFIEVYEIQMPRKSADSWSLGRPGGSAGWRLR